MLGDLDFGSIKDTEPAELFESWLSLPADSRKGMDAEFKEIFEMNSEKSFRAIVD